MRLPAEVRATLDATLDARGHGPVRTLEPVGGGCISETGRIRAGDGSDFFLKWSIGDECAGLFCAEAASLDAIRGSRTLPVPAVIALRDDDADGDAAHDAPGPAGRWLLLEWLEPGRPAAHTWVALGQGLAALHGKREHANGFGWPADNFIGTLEQPNTWQADWPGFWREQRLAVQLALARHAGAFEAGEDRRFDALLDALPEILAPAATDGPSLLHGDLWSGNLHVLSSGDPALIDPASYYGHREVDLAMSDLFGGFDVLFRAAYEEAWPLQPDYERRRTVYQLYFLLVHLNLFGGAYRDRCLAALRAAGF